MAIVNARTVPEGFETKCVDCGDPITAATIKAGEYAHIVRKGSDKETPLLRCECCQEDHREKSCSCDDD
jgi:hypothetical protein